MSWPIGYGWQGTVWADRCMGQSCWVGLVLTGELGGTEPCSGASRGGGPKSRLEPESESVMRWTMCQDWQRSHTTHCCINTQLFFTWPHLFLFFLCLWHVSPVNKTIVILFLLYNSDIFFHSHSILKAMPTDPSLSYWPGVLCHKRFLCEHFCHLSSLEVNWLLCLWCLGIICVCVLAFLILQAPFFNISIFVS